MNLMASTPPSTDTIWQTELKKRRPNNMLFKRPTLLTEINSGLGVKG
jgi:hypothetical protein